MNAKLIRFSQSTKQKLRSLAALGTAAIASQAYAVPVDLSDLTDAIDFSTSITAVLAVAAALIGVYIAWKAAKMVLSAVKGG